MTKPRIRTTFDATTKQCTAEETADGAIYCAFGSTPEEAIARLELAKALTSDCELCREERGRAGGKAANNFCYH